MMQEGARGPVVYAHSRNAQGRRHELVEHLRGVARLARGFAAGLGAEEAGYWLGLWHDVGKFSPAFGRYLVECEANPRARGHGPDHKAAGAHLAARHLGPLALLIQGHHGGLRAAVVFKGWLREREAEPRVAEALGVAQRALPDLEPRGQVPLPGGVAKDALAAELFLRLLFSALVDADYLDTEAHFDAEKGLRRGSGGRMAELWQRFEADQQRLTGRWSDAVGQVRHAVYEACLAAAEGPPGLFRLTVPTGGGKTRSAMAFALRHALRHGQERVIVAVPFISITEQTAEVYRGIFEGQGDAGQVVLEHHSAADEGAEGEDFHAAAVWARLAAENWDAPIVVTTTVQLFESLFASRTSRCRKLHRLARSVVILDEAQALPAHLLTPILEALQQLCAHYGTTVVLSTATQPAFEAIPVFAAAEAREIVPEPGRYFQALKRVSYDWRTGGRLAWGEVAGLVRGAPQALAVLNTKRDALALLEALGDPEALHLSTLLCGAHRRWVIQAVRRRLAAGEPCRLVTTQVVEAGVDLDFPLVLRAMGPLDSIIQAAGRCNREGRLGLEGGRVVVFQPEGGGMPPGAYRTAADITGALLGRGDLDPDAPAVARGYFQQLFASVDTDGKRVQEAQKALNYPEVAQRFRMIDDETESVVVTSYGDSGERAVVRELVEGLRRGGPDGRLLQRRLQPYLVSVRSREAERYRRRGLIAAVTARVGEWLGGYDAVRGLTGDGPDPDALVV